MVLHYTHIQSGDPPSITKQRPGSLEKQHLASCGYNEKLTYQQQGKNIEKYKTLEKIENMISYGSTKPTANCWRETLANTF